MKINNLPNEIAVFPLSNAVFFPRTILPLNIFEERYVQLINDCMKGDRLFGMVQPKLKKKNTEVYSIGCLGKIISFNEVADKRFIISLSGLIRYKILKELSSEKLYRQFQVDYSDFSEDLTTVNDKKEKKDSITLLNKIKIFLKKKGILIDYDKLKQLDLDQLIHTTCMISPFSVEEKQKLIETIKISDKISVLEEIIKFNSIETFESKTIQ